MGEVILYLQHVVLEATLNQVFSEKNPTQMRQIWKIITEKSTKIVK